MASSGDVLYASDAGKGTVLALQVSQVGSGPGRARVLARGLSAPMGIALDEPSDLVFVADAGTGNIERIHGVQISSPPSAEASSAESNSTVEALPRRQVVVRAGAATQISGVAVLPAVTPGVQATRGALDLSRRLVWTETNGDLVRRATLHGTNRESLESVPTYASALATGSAESHLVWPRQVLALGKTPYLEGDLEGPPKSQVLVSEYLGRVWRLNTSEGSSEKKAELVVDATGKAGAATQIRNFLEETARDAALANDKTKVGSFLRLVA